MCRYVSHFFCLLILGWQAFASVVSAQDVMLCLHKDGASKVENKADQQICVAEQGRLQAPLTAGVDQTQLISGGEQGCVDMPLPAVNATTQTAVGQHVDVALPTADLPAVLQIFALPIPAGVAFYGDTTDTDQLRSDVALDTLSSIVLVI